MTITIKRRPGYGEPIVLDLETLVGAVLTRAYLRGADLRGADLTGADLSRANLRGADLRGADLYGAYLHGANLTGFNLHGATLAAADLYGATLRGAKIHDDTLASLLTRIGRSDGFEFFGFRLSDRSIKIKAGCRWLTPDEYRAHVAAEYPDTDKARETLDIIEFIERRAAA